jgi:AcrR family transcriptional regulator
MPDNERKWRRRKDARPSEIVSAALEVFAEKGFAAAKLDDIARKAGISKATLYLYFDTKEEIFRAVARAAVASLLEALESQSEGADAPFAELVPQSVACGRDNEGRPGTGDRQNGDRGVEEFPRPRPHLARRCRRERHRDCHGDDSARPGARRDGAW